MLLWLACNRERNHVVTAAPTTSPIVQKPAEGSQLKNEPTSSPIDEGPRPIPSPPSNSTIKEWLDLRVVPSDLAIGSLNNYDYDLKNLWIWRINAKHLDKFENRRDVDFNIWCTAIPDGWVAVYKTIDQWCLIHSERDGWIWVLVRKDEAIGSEYERNPLYSDLWKEIPHLRQNHSKTDSDGFVTYREIDTIEPCKGEILRAQPDASSISLGPVRGEYLQLISFSGDWVQVVEPMSTQWLPNMVQDEPRPLLRVRWNSKRTGWIRWRIPGPIPGTFHVLLRGTAYFGDYD
jgi:hypothetical protein